MIASVVGSCEVYKSKPNERPKSPGMAYKHYAPSCKTAYFTIDELESALKIYSEEAERGGVPYLIAERKIADEFSQKGLNVFDFGLTGEEMAQNLYALLRQAETVSTLLICVEPTLRGGVMAGVMNRLTRAFGIGEKTE